jgi:sulfur-oxidizing protein SoxY
MRTMLINRRRFLSMMTLLASAVLWPLNAFSAAWRHTAFEATQLSQAEQALGITATTPSKLIDIVAPDKAENGAIVQLEIASRIPNTESMSILVDHNPTPLIAKYVFGLGALPQLVTRIKMADTSEIKVIVKADGQYWSATKKVIVLENGCG